MSTPSYQVLLRLQVHGCFAGASSLDVWLERSLALPFPPYDGLRILHYSDDGETLETHLVGRERTGEPNGPAEIYWDVKHNRFVVYLSDQEIYWAQLRKQEHRPLKEIVNGYLADGWQRETKEADSD